eukprot:m.227126 g.227126  ORF g.227126 m.227126 type:complete len:355 (-) comp19222_c0_seq1:135-1199(-)
MGICMSAEQREQAARNAAIEKQLAADQDMANRTVKLLLLGAGESGKSTLVKQMKIIHGDGYTQEELKSYRPTVCDNLVHSMRAVLQAMGQLRINLGDQSNRVHVKSILEYQEVGKTGRLPDHLAEAIRCLWKDSGVQDCYRRSNEYQLNDSAAYYFERIDYIADASYTPNKQDVLRARVKTTGIIETSFRYKNMIFRMFDVGGQRSERKKWIQCFDGVTAVIFVSALCGYDMKLFEDQQTNRVHESLTLFDAICNNKFFTNTSMILFLNKVDLFEQKIQTHPLVDYFPEYNGPSGDALKAREFILQMFLKLNKNPSKKIYHHYTCATDTKNIQIVFDAVSDILIESNLAKIGLN